MGDTKYVKEGSVPRSIFALSASVFCVLISACFPSFDAELLDGGDSGEDADISRDGDLSEDAERRQDVDADLEFDADDDSCVPGCDGVCEAGQWVRICAGIFLMGSPFSEDGRSSDVETPHIVTLTRDYLILSTEVTQAEFQSLLPWEHSFSFPGCPDCPAETLNWHEAAYYCNLLSDEEGYDPCYDCNVAGTIVRCTPRHGFETPYDCPGYRLPMTAEWEYAARSGTFTSTYAGETDINGGRAGFILDNIAWWDGNSEEMTHPVADRDSSPWGLYDMIGNVTEWCHDEWSGQPYDTEAVVDPIGYPGSGDRALRGGAWQHDATRQRAAVRWHDYPENYYWTNGFRPVRTL